MVTVASRSGNPARRIAAFHTASGNSSAPTGPPIELVNTSSWPWVRALLHSVYDQPDAASVHAQFDRVLDALGDKLPAVAEHLDTARADVLAFTAFPKEVWRQIWSNNPSG